MKKVLSLVLIACLFCFSAFSETTYKKVENILEVTTTQENKIEKFHLDELNRQKEIWVTRRNNAQAKIDKYEVLIVEAVKLGCKTQQEIEVVD